MRSQILLIFLFLTTSLFAQTEYGNDWINHSQTYYKIKISEDGVYRISQEQLQQAGLPLSQINPKNFQLFNKGQEVPLIVSGESDNVFNAGDYIEFYGQKNDGKLDRPLYNNPTDQPHQYYSLYTDTAAYFLTWSSNPGKRFASFTAPSTGLTPENFFMHQSVSYFADTYYPGAYNLIETMTVSEYTAGEGIFGNTFSASDPQVRAVKTPFVYLGSAPAITAETFVAGRTNANSTAPSGANHHLRIEAGNGSSYSIKKDTLFKGYAIGKNTFTLTPVETGAQTYFRFSAVNDLGASTDNIAPAYVKVTYPRSFDLSGTSSLEFTIKGSVASQNSLIRFNNSTLNAPVLLDLTNSRSLSVSTNAGVLEAVIPNAGTEKNLFLYNNGDYKTASVQSVSFTNFAPSSSDKNFLIITNKILLDKASAYAAYRNQTGYKTLLVTTDQLYDQFYYGVHHPLAIRNFCKFLLEKAAVKPDYLLLLGKGQSNFLVRSSEGLAKDLVPGIGNPPSDNMFTSGLAGTNWEPAIATGRIAAKTPQDVEVYLNKLKMYEAQPDSLYRKKIIHVSGGNTLFENLQWTGYQNSFLAEASKEPFGAWAVNFQKNVTQPVADNITGKIVSEINKGSSFLSFFGHGSAQALEINFGEPSTLSNKNKLLVYMINGCNAGNPFADVSLGERMIFEPEKAAIGWLATSDEGVAYYLASFSKILYRNLFNTLYGKPVAQSLKATVKSYQNPSEGSLNQAHSRQYIWQGDPALKFYSPQKADFYIENKDLFIYPQNTTAKSDSFAVAIIAKNLGKAFNSKLSVSVKQVLPDNSQVVYSRQIFEPVYNRDTLYFYITPQAANIAGNNKFIVSLDSDNAYDELNESNNTAEFNFFMPSNGVNNLFPLNNSIVGSSPVKLRGQSTNLLAGDQEYIFEIDTVKSFDSNWKKTSGIIVQNVLPEWTPNFTPENNKVYYWRLRLNRLENDGGVWQTSSFTYVASSAEGWSQSHRDQFASISPQGLFYDPGSRSFKFSNTTFVTSVRTKGDDAAAGEERAYRSIPGGRLGYAYWEFDGLALVALNPQTMKTFTYPSNFNMEGFYRYSGEFHFNPNNAAELDSMVNYINSIPAGFIVVGHNGRNISFKDLPQKAKTALQTLGLSQFTTVGLGEPYMFWGQKGSTAGTAIEKMADPSSGVSARNQIIYFEKEYYYPFTTGQFMSDKFGPSKQWKQLNLSFETDASDNFQIDLIGVRETGIEETIKTNISKTTTDLADVDANTYPFLRLKATMTDTDKRTPAQLKSLKILNTPLPEATVNPVLKNSFHSESIAEGDSLRWELAYQNISSSATDSILAYYTLTKSDRSTVKSLLGSFAPLKAGESINTNLLLPTKGLGGSNSVRIEFVPKDGKDIYSFNNFLNRTFEVIKDVKEPLVDVFFDGKRIVNNEIISAKPTISITVSDDSQFLLLSDTSTVEISLKKHSDDFTGPDPEFRRVWFSSNQLAFIAPSAEAKNKATVEFRPEKFEDGKYTLKIKGKDISGNSNTANDYEIDFEVVNESSVTHFFPYPNPFSTSTRFVFTLTGETVPDKIKVQILTSGGKIVREVFKEELGAIRIGNNISEFAWDGTDQFGDKLANGVYFYRVLIENNDKSAYKHRITQGDKFFEKGFGKIYLLR